MATSRLSTKIPDEVRPGQQAQPMARRERPQRPQAYPAEKARGGEIILRTRTRRWIFIGGLATAVILPLLLLALAH